MVVDGEEEGVLEKVSEHAFFICPESNVGCQRNVTGKKLAL